jgi:hypothetical protein
VPTWRAHRLLPLLALAAVSAFPDPAWAQSSDSSVSVWGAVGLAMGPSVDLTTTYVPELKYFGVISGSGGQMVTLDRSAHLVATFGAAVFFTPHLGVEAWASHDTLSQDASSGPYSTALRYISRPPPNYDPVVVDYQRADEWGPVATSVAQWTAAFNGVARWGPREPWARPCRAASQSSIRPGPSEPLGYTMFVLGGHSTLVPNEHQLVTEIVPTTVVRGNVGGSIDVRLGDRTALTIGLRQTFGPPIKSSLRVVAVDYSRAGFDPPPLADITSQLGGSAVSIGAVSFKATVGLKAYV